MVDIQTIGVLVTATSVTIAAIYYIITLRSNNKTRRAQMFMQIYDHWNDDDFSKHYLNIWGYQPKTSWETSFKDFDDFKSRVIENTEKYRSLAVMIRFFEGIGVMVKEGLIDIRLVALTMAGDTKIFWEMLKPVINQWRLEMRYPRLCDETEYLYGELMKYMDQHPELKT
ncbi:MAG: hypothetical protein NTY03_03420 [Candidatus Bathyarchaeota archaeon]|jgi:hypothetical protein|nr:hypothetical protein [Candidatus Bathyarchaeota archaeon]